MRGARRASSRRCCDEDGEAAAAAATAAAAVAEKPDCTRLGRLRLVAAAGSASASAARCISVFIFSPGKVPASADGALWPCRGWCLERW